MREPIQVPDDIKLKVSTSFKDVKSYEHALAIITEFHERKRGLNVGPSQFCRAILVLADGDIVEFNRLAELPTDPRDILMDGDAKIGSPNHYFVPPFGDAAYESDAGQ